LSVLADIRSGSAASALRTTPIRISRAQFNALSPYHQAVAIVYLRRGTGEVVLVEDAAEQPFVTTGA